MKTLLSILIVSICVLKCVYAQEKPDAKFFDHNGLSFTFGVHNNFNFQEQSQIDTSCIGTGSCVILKSMGLQNISPVFGCDFGFRYNISKQNKFSITPSLSYSNRRIKYKVDSLTLINNLNNYPVNYQDVVKFDISRHCLDLGLFFEYQFMKNKFSIYGGVKYTIITFIHKKLTHFEKIESSESRTCFFYNRHQIYDFPPRSVPGFHPSILFSFNYIDKNKNTLLKPFIGIEMDNLQLYYFQFGIEVPIKPIFNSYLKSQ